ncbi:MAG: hypothetical protein ACK4FK_04230 [Ferrovibrio sp.]|uniref:hypothetical protein n=1 Tax=Ferrovibrio sp. TaxID=1917215 RepID=UPI0039191160
MTMAPRLFVLSGLAAAVLLAVGGGAQPASGQVMPPAQPAGIGASIDDSTAFNSTERWLIPYYFQRKHADRARASRAKSVQRSLPAGIATAPRKGDTLPLDVAARLHNLPGPLLRDLPPARPDTARLVVGADVILLRRSSGEVLDVMAGVIN